MTRPARAENQPSAAPTQPRDTPSVGEAANIDAQARPKKLFELYAQDQPGAFMRNADIGDYLRAKEQPKAFQNNFATDSARVLNGHLWIPIPYLDGLRTAYMLESMINSTTPPIPSAILSELTSLSALVKEKQKLLAEQKDNLSKARWIDDSKHTQVADADTAKSVRKQDDRIRTLCTDVLEKLVSDPLIAQEEYEAGTSHIAHVRNVLEDTYEKCNPVLLEQIREYEQTITEKAGTSVGGKRDKLKAFFVNNNSKGVSQPVAEKVQWGDVDIYRALDQPEACVYNTYNTYSTEGYWSLRPARVQPGPAPAQTTQYLPSTSDDSQGQPAPGTVPYLDALCVAYSTLEETMNMVASAETAAIREAASTQRKLLDEIRATLVDRHKTGVTARQIQASEADIAKQIRKQDIRVRQLTTKLTDEAVQDPQFPNNEHNTGITWEEYAKNELEDVYQKCRPLLLEQVRVMDEILAEKGKQPQRRRDIWLSCFRSSPGKDNQGP
ncbi:hypothetical protein HII31_10436 [Pseudocercospora fuligena]|uniref:Uncharacterized protein n=1 Tax=Pseudocercospora fuligena TaxID=685502 RepID=A0A8H6RDP6_9PEZI|nr:hypothetical protein HII31_10436 [Pseudocercospora fuligena]